MTMTASNLIALHVLIFAAVGLTMYAVLVMRNAVFLFLIPAIKRLTSFRRDRKMVSAAQRSCPLEMPGQRISESTQDGGQSGQPTSVILRSVKATINQSSPTS